MFRHQHDDGWWRWLWPPGRRDTSSMVPESAVRTSKTHHLSHMTRCNFMRTSVVFVGRVTYTSHLLLQLTQTLRRASTAIIGYHRRDHSGNNSAGYSRRSATIEIHCSSSLCLVLYSSAALVCWVACVLCFLVHNYCSCAPLLYKSEVHALIVLRGSLCSIRQDAMP